MKKHLNKIIILISAAAVLYGCSDNKKSDYVAKVGEDSYLTESDLSLLLDSTQSAKDLANTYIHNWVEQEVLYQEAIKKNITEDPKYKLITENSKKRLAGVLLLNKIREENLTYNESEIKSFYEAHKNEFKFNSENLLLNIVHFNNEDEAIKFRSMAIENGWDNALKNTTNKNALLLSENRKLYPIYHLNPLILSNVSNILMPSEVSIVLRLDENRFAVIQLLNKYNNEDLPPYDLVRDEVKKRFEAGLMEQRVNSYIKNLYSKYEIDIKEKK